MPRVTDKQLRGVLLEEAVLYLLRHSGYRTVDPGELVTDVTLASHSAGLAVHGRGERHQIDAIADFCISPPFGHPLRLLVEAKCYASKVGIATVRNAVGVLKDVSEYWVFPPASHGTRRRVAHKRFHYQYAVFATCGYTAEAQRYAFAHDIYLIPLAESAFFRPIIDALNAVTVTAFGPAADKTGFLRNLRSDVRDRLRGEPFADVSEDNPGVAAMVYAVNQVGEAYLAVLGGHLPVFLTPGGAWKELSQERPGDTPG